MRLHVVALPHTQTTDEFSTCAYTNKVRGFCKMMMSIGHEVILYAGEQNEAPCTEHVVCISEAERRLLVGQGHYTSVSWDDQNPLWRKFNMVAVANIGQRLQPHDIVCLIGGTSQKLIADFLPEAMVVEFGVGYGGVFSKYRVFESYAWMHVHYGAAQRTDPDGKFYDAVIPGYLDPAQFPFKLDPVRDLPPTNSQLRRTQLLRELAMTEEPYFLFIGRLIDRKGYRIAVDACKAAGVRLITAGPGEPPDPANHVGEVGPLDRGRLMQRAQAVFVPTIYVEPFGNVAIEAQACGTPAITTDWGAFTETVIDGVTGIRCRTLQEFVDAIETAPKLDPHVIRQYAVSHYSHDVVAKLYDRYFQRLQTLWGAGWPQLRDAA